MDKSDFDELDRAVQSLVSDKSDPTSQATPTASQTEPAAEPVSSPDPVAPAVSQPSAEPASVVPEPVEPAKPEPSRPSPTIAQRPRGRFMDIVPSRKTNLKAPTEAPSRSGISLTPPTDPVPERPEPVEDPVSEPEPTPVLPEPVAETPEPAPAVEPDVQPAVEPKLAPAPAEPAEPSTDMPDPIDSANAVMNTVEPEESDDASDDFDNEIASIAGLDGDDNQAPASPFISGANVEKRPLGGEPASNQPDDVVVDPVDSIEKEPDTSQANTQPEPVAAPVEKPARNEMKGAKVSPAPAESNGPTSISQQYKVSPDDKPTEPSSGSMYDAENYTQPLAHPAKKKSGWLGVFWIILLLAVGGGGAFVAYQLQLF